MAPYRKCWTVCLSRQCKERWTISCDHSSCESVWQWGLWRPRCKNSRHLGRTNSSGIGFHLQCLHQSESTKMVHRFSLTILKRSNLFILLYYCTCFMFLKVWLQYFSHIIIIFQSCPRFFGVAQHVFLFFLHSRLSIIITLSFTPVSFI